MKFIDINPNNDSIEIEISKDDMILILKTLSNIEIGLAPGEHLVMLNIDYSYVRQMLKDFDELPKYFDKNISQEKSHSVTLKDFNQSTGMISLYINYKGFKAMRGALAHTTVWVYEEDCPIMMGITWEELTDVKCQLLQLLRKLAEDCSPV